MSKTVEVIHCHKKRENKETRESQSANNATKPLENAETNSMIINTFINESNSNLNNGVKIATTTNYGLHTPCFLEGEKVIAFVDGGASNSFVSKNFVEKKKWVIEPQSGSVKQAFANTQVPRIGIIRKKLLENAQKRVLIDLEVVNLEDQETLIIGLDLFKLLGYEISNIPFTWPQPTDNHTKKVKPKYDDTKPDGVDQNGIAEEWKKVLEDNQALPKNSKCKLPDAELAIETKGDPV